MKMQMEMDLVLGDLSFQNLNKLVNGGDASLHIVEQDTVFPGYDIPVDMTTFPAPFLLDVDLDGRQGPARIITQQGRVQYQHT